MHIGDKIKLLAVLTNNLTPSFLDDFNQEKEPELFKEVNDEMEKLRQIVSDKNVFSRLIACLISLEQIDNFLEILNHKFKINLFTDKYGNKYLQARTRIKVGHEMVWVNAYLGTLAEYPKGISDPLALEKGGILLRKKMLKLFLKK